MSNQDLINVIWPEPPKLEGTTPTTDEQEQLRRYVHVALVSMKCVADYHDVGPIYVLDPKTGEWVPL